MAPRNLIREALLSPQLLPAQSASQWDLLIRQARRANLLGRLAHSMADHSLLDSVPAAPRQHLLAAMLLAKRQAMAVRWEVECLMQAFAGTGLPLILLKGAAYVMAGLPASIGRVFSDVDLIVPRPLLGNAESALMQHGWRCADTSAYDQRYYREWMHEIPPMTHVRRGTTVDLHHSILPETARVSVKVGALLDAITPVAGVPGLHVLQPLDMVLHSASHLFHEGELENGQRDLFDLDSLLRHFGTEPDFWHTLAPRARELGLARPLYHALRYTTTMLGTPVPREAIEGVLDAEPTALVGRCMDFCYERALRPMHASCDDRWTGLARTAVYVRSHWLRMPLPLLVVHLGRKALMRNHSPDVGERLAAPADRGA
ncbi:MAG: nucleotidyltransferase family protein [Burkholderiales bacterium]|nr:nucleotidyltransferase family protein [Burkholderiales bacterium]